jgi:ABC-type nitrate/sulfonate/bicarbonate transport system substrate-binding protein
MATTVAIALVSCGGTPSPAGGSSPTSGSARATSSSSPAAKAAGVPIRLGASQNITTNAPVWLTQQTQLFQKNGLNVDLQSISSTTGIKQLVAGQLDAVVAGAPESITARAAGSPIQIVAVLQTSCDMEMVVRNDVTSVSQLKGKTVAVITKPSVQGICTVADLRKHGLEPDTDYKLIETGSAGTYGAIVAALQSKNADAGALQPDFAHKLEQAGQVHTLYDMGTEQGLLTAASSLTFASAFIQAHPNEVQKSLDSLLQGEAYYKQQKDEAQSLLKTVFKISDQTQLEETYTRQGQLMAKDITPREALFPDMIAALAQLQPDVKQLDLSSLLNQRFAQSAMDRGLTNF